MEDRGAKPRGGTIPSHVKAACPAVNRVVVVQVHAGEPFSKQGARPVGRGRCLENSHTSDGVHGFESLALRHSPSFHRAPLVYQLT